MKRGCIFLVALVCAVMLLSPAANAQDADGVLEDTLTDSLASGDDVRWYSFEMREQGDAVIYVTGRQEQWDGYIYHWRCAIYEDDRETALGYADVRGFTGNYGPSIIAVPDIDAGIYYVRVTTTGSGNPFMTSFTAEPYELELVRYYHSAEGVYDGDEIQTFRNAGDILWSYDGTGFLKRNDGECFGALTYSRNGAVVPVLIAEEKTSVEYVISSTGEIVKAKGPIHHEDSGKDYYFSDCDYVEPYAEKRVKADSLPMLYMDTASPSAAAEEIADKLLKAELGAKDYWLLKYKGKVVGILSTVGIIVGYVCFCNFAGISVGDRDDSFT